MEDEELYRHARLVTSAVIAKVHTIDWTLELLKTGTLRAGMRANWVDVVDLIGRKGEESLSTIGFTRQMVSMGHQSCGALELWNYPCWMRDLVPQSPDEIERPNHIDLRALEGK
ncbi:unnamed protein product [Cuscuta campestris]|uniref:Uncharacterized protein n=1 Tax=Cuscuta campestris TaxID=132261 RepID=A0A484K275_9ASTE|nr:unnamed protein product [Cuscuta campestris]